MTSPADRREIKINVTVDSDTRGSDQAAKSLEGVDKSAGNAEKGLKDLKKESESLDTQLSKSRLKVKELEEELRRTGDRSTGRGSLRGMLGSERSWLRELERLKKDLPNLELPQLNFSGLLGQSRGVLIAGLVGVAVAASPIIGAVISGAVAGTVAGGGIAGGVIAAAADTRVRSAFKDLVSEFTSEAFGGGAFVGPVVEGLRILQSTFRSLNLDETLAKGASSVTILARGIGDLVRNLMPGFNAVMDKAEAFTTVFGQGLSDTGAALSDFLISITSSEGTIEGLHFGFKILTGSIIATGNVLEFLGDVFHGLVVFGAPVTGFLEDVFDWITRIGSAGLLTGGPLQRLFSWFNDNLEDTERVGYGAGNAVAAVGGVIRELPEPTDDAAQAFKKLNDEFERGIDLQASYITDQLDVEEGLQNLADLFAENGDDLSAFTDEGRENQRALVALAREMRQVRDDQIAMGVSTADADAALEANHQRLLDQAEAAGISRQAIEDLIAALFRVPKLNFMGTGNPAGSSDSPWGGGLQEFATGGVVQGPRGSAQMVIAHAGERVLTEEQQRSRYVVPNGGGGGMGWGGGGVLQIEVGGSPSGPLESLFMQWLGNALAKYVSTVGLGNGGIIGVRTVSG